MARDISELDEANSGRERPENGDKWTSNTLLDRRSYLKLTGVTTAALAASGAVSASGDEYEVIEANNSNYHLDDGEVFENKIIDFSNGNWLTIIANATNWTIRNVGFRGIHDHDHNAIVAQDSGGNSSTIENVYLGDGCVRPDSYSSHGQCGIFVHRGHSGHLDIRNVYAEDWPNNGIYASAAAYDTPGTVTLENCFAKNNYVASLRVSDGGKVIDCVAYNDGNGRYQGRPFWGWGDQEIVGCDLDGGSYANGSSIYGRSGSTTYVEDTRHSGYSMSGSGSYSEGSDVVNGSADLSVPGGVPTSAEEAASGSSGSDDDREDETRGDHEDLQHTYEFVGEDEPTDYYFEVEEGPIEPSTYNEATIEENYMWISDDGTRAAGRVIDGHHAWEFDTLLIDVTVEGPAEPIINDVESNLDRYPRDGATGDGWKGDMPWHDNEEEETDDGEEEDGQDDEGHEFDHTYEFVAEGESESTDYYFEIEDGPIEPSNYNGATVEDDYMWVSDDGTRAAGRVVDGRHAWEFDTQLVDVTVEGPAEPIVNDQESHLSRYPLSGATGDEWKGDMPWHDSGEHTYEFVADGESEPTDYYFEIEDGSTIVPSTYNGASIEDNLMWVSDDGTRAAGRVVDGRHAWEFDTLLVDVTVEGPAEPIINDQESHLSRYPLSGATGDDWKGDMPWHVTGEHTYEFVAEGESEPTDYYFEIEDGSSIEPSMYNGATIEDDYMWVSDDGTRAAGRVVDGRHAWEFDTLLVDATVEGPAEPIVNDQQSHLNRYPRDGATGDDWKGDMPWHDGDS